MSTVLPGDGSSIFSNFDGTAVSQSLGSIAKESLQNGYFDLKDTTDLYGNSIQTQTAWKNPNYDTEAAIKDKLYNGNGTGWNGMNAMPHGWDNPNASERATVTELGRPMNDAEVDQLQQVNGILNDFHRHGNIQSGVEQNDWGQNNLFGMIGKHKSFHLPSGQLPKPVGQMLSIGQGLNALNTSLGAAAAVGTGPCKFIDDLFGAISRGGAVLSKILGFISQALGLLNLISGIIGFITQLANMILQDLKNLAGAIQKITNAAIAGLLDGLMSDPCLKHLITAGIAGFGLLQTIKKFT
jgi:hypothetical protein|tara:strand:- start:61 stop:951 length:891 start_codon:yes stop_codon:yes gene_type:complete